MNDQEKRKKLRQLADGSIDLTLVSFLANSMKEWANAIKTENHIIVDMYFPSPKSQAAFEAAGEFLSEITNLSRTITESALLGRLIYYGLQKVAEIHNVNTLFDARSKGYELIKSTRKIMEELDKEKSF